MSTNRDFAQWLRYFIVLLFPFFLGCSWITLVIGSTFPRYEYAKTHFPPDPNDVPWTAEERLDLVLVAVTYLESWQSPTVALPILMTQQQPHTNEPLYNQREYDHLRDVKEMTDMIRTVAFVTTICITTGILFLLRNTQTRTLAYLAVGQGGLLTLILVGSITSLILFSWGVFFYQFHALLFPAGSWSFAATDSLMRLYPETFFFDAAVVMCVGTWSWGLLLLVTGYLGVWHSMRIKTREGVPVHVTKVVR